LLVDEAADLPEAASQAGNLFSLRMPLPMTNMISGGKHAGGNLDIQDVLVTPLGAPDYPTGLEWIVRVYRRLGKLLRDASYEGYLVGDEGGYGPRLKGNREALQFVVRAIEAADLTPGSDMALTLDIASTHFYRQGRYQLAADQSRGLTNRQMIDMLQQWSDQFPIASIEDGLAEEDWEGWRELTQRLGDRVKLVGDDLFATNLVRLEKGIELKAANAILIKANQIGTLTETFRAMLCARLAGFTLVVSARSGETEDDFLSDLAVASGAEYIKVGSIARSERLAKYNRLLRIAEEI
jgi:enolase